jgi:xylulokinase
MLPRVLGPEERAGEVPASIAARFGLAPGAVVGPGAGDNAAAGLALGLQPGEAALSLGTSGTVFVVAERPSADPEGVVAGFASADGGYLPLVCTLNATVAVDRVAAWLGLGRDDVAPSGEVVFLPWLDGERTPNLPGASGTLSGLRHDTDLRSVLQAAYEGAAATLLAGLERIETWAPLAQGAPLLLVGGGARGPVWREAVRRLSGRAVVVPEASELVALGAAVQAAAVLEGRRPREVTSRWGTRRGSEEGALPKDVEKLGRIQAWGSLVGSWAAGLRRS